MQMNQAQEQAVLHKDGPMLVLAGPGSGKTLVITERTKHLITEYMVAEEHILVITFTKAAAEQMKNRFLLSMGKEYTGVSFGTFHAIFFTILKYAYHLSAANIIREEDKYRLLKEIVNVYDQDYEDEKEFLSELFSEISLVKTGQITLEDYYSVNCGAEVFRSIYKEFEHRLHKARLIDFDDMLVLCYRLLKERQDILSLWQKKFEYILIDEFQDINKIQYEIIRMLAAPKNNLFIVGDDDQSIYRFRGAVPEIMLGFPKDYPECRSVALDVNYRTTSNIVKACGRLIGYNKNRFHKEIKAYKPSGNNIVIMNFNTLSDENQRLVYEISCLNKEGLCLKDMAILVRTNQGFGALLHKLMEYNIPFIAKDSLPNLFDHFIAIDIIAYMKLAMGSTDRSLYLQIINRPKRYISRECFDSPVVDFEAVKDYHGDKNWMLERLNQFEYDLGILSGMVPYAAINYIRRGIGYEGYLTEYADSRRIKAEDLISILEELQESSRSFKSFEEWFAYMEEYKKEIKRQLETKKNDTIDRVTIATMHNAKGLEFKVVFIVDANEGIIPHKKAVLPADIEEERRLFYVAMTRAKEKLYIYSAKERYNKVMIESRFISEVKGGQESG